ncbi:hypothetical protein N836_21570 [Leptolyngbya sp. Heron Island J]|nr:hypothetical protein N836_21570 [Leptolyngbya sp. Heron Island J]
MNNFEVNYLLLGATTRLLPLGKSALALNGPGTVLKGGQKLFGDVVQS